MKTKELDYKSAIQELASVAEIDLDADKAECLSELMRDAAMYYHQQLKSNPKAKSAIDFAFVGNIRQDNRSVEDRFS